MKKFDNIKVISFDGDGTLWDFDKVMRNSLKYVLKVLNEMAPQASQFLDVNKMIKTRNQVFSNLKGKEKRLEKFRFYAFKQTLEETGIFDEDLAHLLNNIYLKHRFEDIKLYDDILPTLNTLREKYKLILISNGNSYPEKCGLDGMFEFAIFSQDCGFEKPDPKIFQFAMELVKCKNEELIHVGDSLQNDVLGANLSRIKSIWRTNYLFKGNWR